MPLQNKYLQDLVEQFEDLKISARKVVEGLTEEQFNAQPAPHKWSIAECIDHLNSSYRAYIPVIKKVIKNNTNETVNNPDNFKIRFRFKLSNAWLEPPYKMKMKTFDLLVPDEKLNKEKTISKFISLTDEFIDFIKISEKVDLKCTIVISPVTSALKFRLGELYPFIASHNRRHLWQAENVKKIIS